MKVSDRFHRGLGDSGGRLYDRSHDDGESPGQAYYSAMGHHKLLTMEEEAKYSRMIWNNFQAIVDLVRSDRSGIGEVGQASKQIKKWEGQGQGLKPRQSYLRALMDAVFIVTRLHPKNESSRELYNAMRGHRSQIEVARDIMIQANLRLVVSIARTYRGMGLPLDDLVQEGNIGLMRAVMRYDYRVGSRFATYGSWWIRQSISNGLIQKTRTIQLPFHVRRFAKRFNQAVEELRNELDREPTMEEISLQSGMKLEEITSVAGLPGEPVSLDMPVNDGDLTLAHLLKDTCKPVYHRIVQRELRVRIRECLQTLSERERIIIVSRFGLESEAEKTLKEIGGAMRLSRERIRQLEMKAVQKLQRTDTAVKLDYYCS